MKPLTEHLLKVQDTYFRILGFNILARPEQSGWRQHWRPFVLMISLAMVQAMVVAFSVQNLDDMDQLTEGLAALLINQLGLFKFGLMMWLHKDFQLLVARLRELLTRVPACIVGEENRREQRLSGIYKNSFMLAAILSSLKPSVSMCLNYRRTGQLRLEMTFPCSYPWDNRQLPYALLSYALLTSASFAVVLPSICTSQHQMQLIRAAADSRAQLGKILDLYRRSLDLSDALNRYFRLLICVQFLVGSLHLCVLSYTLLVKFDNPQMPFYVVFTVSVLSQLYIFCYCGDRLKTASTGFANAIYDSPWHELTIGSALGRSLQFSMMRAHRGSRIDGFFFEANMEVFIVVSGWAQRLRAWS
ncbi:putative odorant receptor 98b isoform X2 [Drosophila montana]|uniref:putative odorant receptor 98b isoform X2 n=1 Tax=Drosophila montana TaxID=40370 RepID=UPI00313F3D23